MNWEARLRPDRIAGQSAKKSPYINGPYRKPTQVDGRIYQGARVKPGQGTRQNSPVTSEEGVPPLGGRSEMAQPTV